MAGGSTLTVVSVGIAFASGFALAGGIHPADHRRGDAIPTDAVFPLDVRESPEAVHPFIETRDRLRALRHAIDGGARGDRDARSESCEAPSVS